MFKVFNLQPKTVAFDWGQMSCITLGESGRGRKQVIVPCEQVNDYANIVMSKTAKPKIVAANPTVQPQHWIARISTDGVYTRNTSGWIGAYDPATVQVIARGWGAEGAAGRIGSWDDVIVTVQDGALVRVKKHGGHKTPATFLFFDQNEVKEFSSLENLLAAIDFHDLPFEISQEVMDDDVKSIFKPIC